MCKLGKARAGVDDLKRKCIALSDYTGPKARACSVSAEDSGGPDGRGFGFSLLCFPSGRLHQEHGEAELREGAPV